MAVFGSAYADVMEISTCAVGTSSSLVRRPRMKKTVPSSEQTTPVQIPPVGTEGVVADVNMAPTLKKQKKEFCKNIRASSKGVNLEAVEQEALDLATRDPICLDTQIRSSISQLSVAWKSAAEVVKLATANRGELVRQHDAEKATLQEQFKQEKVLQREQFEKEAAATKQEVEDEAKKAVDIAVASQNKLIQAFYFWGLSREDLDLALAGKYGEIVYPGDDASLVAEQTPTSPVADDPTKEGQRAMRILFFNIKKEDRNIHPQLEIDLRHACDELEWCKSYNACLERENVKCVRLLQNSEKRVTLLEARLLDTQQRLQVSQSRSKKKITPKRGKRVIDMDHKRQMADVIAFYGGELERVKNEFRRYISSCGKDVEVENNKVENMRFAKGNEGGGASTSKPRAEVSEEEKVEDLLPYTRHKTHPQEVLIFNKPLQVDASSSRNDMSCRNEYLLIDILSFAICSSRTTLLNSKLESEMLELQSQLNAVTVELSCKDTEILIANNESKLWKESLKKKKLETMVANQHVLDLLNSKIRYMSERLKKLNWDLREARDLCQRKNDRAKTHEEASSKRDRKLNEAINKYNSWIADLDRDKQALVQECIQENVTLRAMAMLHADVDKFRTERESILAATTEYVTEYDLILARLSSIDNLIPRVMELLNAPSTVVDAAIPFPILVSYGPREILNV
ncbi:hypothetical protein GIB67_030768, partial [Kingdonia uniflora]